MNGTDDVRVREYRGHNTGSPTLAGNAVSCRQRKEPPMQVVGYYTTATDRKRSLKRSLKRSDKMPEIPPSIRTI